MNIEYTKNENCAMAVLFSKLILEHQSKKNLVNLIIGGDLCEEQIQNIVVAIRSDLTESQLCDLFEYKISADKMQKIIESAKLENQMGYNS